MTEEIKVDEVGIKLENRVKELEAKLKEAEIKNIVTSICSKWDGFAKPETASLDFLNGVKYAIDNHVVKQTHSIAKIKSAEEGEVQRGKIIDADFNKPSGGQM